MIHNPWIYKSKKNRQLIFIVGQNPGKSNAEDKLAFVGNKTGSYVTKLLNEIGLENVYLTNVSDNELLTESNLELGKIKLFSDLRRMKPSIVITMGKIAELTMLEYMNYAGTDDFKWFACPHPSHALRFNIPEELECIKETLTDAKELSDE